MAARISICMLLALGCDAQPDATSAAQSALQVCAPGAVLEGVDVSYYQGAIDWAKVKQSGRAFAIARVADGIRPDTLFASYWPEMAKAGLVRGTYQYFRANDDPIAQADLLLQRMGPLSDGDLPPALDIETLDGQSPSVVVQKIETWLVYLRQKLGRAPLIYSSPGFWNMLGNPDRAHDLLWDANWKVNCPNVTGTWTTWQFWQYSDSGVVPGISGGSDVDRFNGDLAALHQVASPPRGPVLDPGVASLIDGGSDVPGGAGVNIASARSGCSFSGAPMTSALLWCAPLLALLVRRRRFTD